MEVNTRFWGSLQLAIDAGIDFPRWLLLASTGRDVPGNTSYRIGTRLRWLLGDLDRSYIAYREAENWRGKVDAITDFLANNPFAARNEVFRWRDPRPAWFELKGYLASLRTERANPYAIRQT